MADARYEFYGRGRDGVGGWNGDGEEPAPGMVAGTGGEAGAGEDGVQMEEVGGAGGREGGD